jgi:hypothetical protein
MVRKHTEVTRYENTNSFKLISYGKWEGGYGKKRGDAGALGRVPTPLQAFEITTSIKLIVLKLLHLSKSYLFHAHYLVNHEAIVETIETFDISPNSAMIIFYTRKGPILRTFYDLRYMVWAPRTQKDH